MKRVSLILAALASAQLAPPAAANFLVEQNFAQKFEQADLVLIGTATTVDRGGRRGFGATATLSVWRTLKGEHRDTITVSTFRRIAEADPRCCEVGTTYMMFLRGGRDGTLHSVNGAYGMVRIAGPGREVQIIESAGGDAESVGDIELPAEVPPQ